MRRTHPEWCARGHRCGLGEHRSEPLVVTVNGLRLVVTRVRGRDGAERAEITAVQALDIDERRARVQLSRLLAAFSRHS
jgi:hypothetical protein